MRRIISLLAVVLLLMLLGCGQTSKKPLRKTYVDSLKTRIDNLSSSIVNDYENL